jgi:cell division septation protein DedD
MTWPDAVPFDPVQGTASPAVEALLEGPGSRGPVLLLAVGAAAQRSGWAARAAVTLADAFAARGEQVVLADLSLRNPELHDMLGVGNDEGLTDVFLFGASLEHITHKVKGKQFSLIPASAYTPDPDDVLQHNRWGGLFEELSVQKQKLIVYLPVDVEGAHAFSDRVGHTIVLAERTELDSIRATLSEDADVLALFFPGQPPIRRGDEEFERIRMPKGGARDALIADLRNRQREALMAPAPTMAPLPSEVSTQRLPPSPKAPLPMSRPKTRTLQKDATPLFTFAPPEPEPKRRWLPWFALLALLAVAGGAGWYWYQMQGEPEIGPIVQRPLARPPARPIVSLAKPLPYSVAVASYQTLNLAQDRIRQLEDIRFYVAPIVLQNTLFYRVLAGPIADSAAAVAMRDTLIATGIKTAALGSDVVATPYAFLLGEFTVRAEAERTQQEAEAKGIPSYIVAMMSSDGSTKHRLYAGAFMGQGDAEFMHPILKAAGLPDNLVERTGSIQ